MGHLTKVQCMYVTQRGLAIIWLWCSSLHFCSNNHTRVYFNMIMIAMVHIGYCAMVYIGYCANYPTRIPQHQDSPMAPPAKPTFSLDHFLYLKYLSIKVWISRGLQISQQYEHELHTGVPHPSDLQMKTPFTQWHSCLRQPWHLNIGEAPQSRHFMIHTCSYGYILNRPNLASSSRIDSPASQRYNACTCVHQRSCLWKWTQGDSCSFSQYLHMT